MVSNVDKNNKDVQEITERVEGGLFKCKICGVKFDNASAYEGHIAAGHLTPSP
jgi:ribosomal protein L37AE/L43A